VKCLADSSAGITLDTMIARPDDFIAQAGTHVAAVVAAISVLMLATGVAWPQGGPPPSPGVQAPVQQAAPQQTEPAPSPEPPARDENPGLINELEKLWDKSKSMLPTMKSPQQTIDDLNARAKDATKDAGESLSRLAKPASMVSGRMVCPVSTNGAPDCKLGADKLCQSKGFKEGKSLNADSAETCSARVLISGRVRKPDDCRTDTYVTRALCQ
jgi:hypothetical protein